MRDRNGSVVVGHRPLLDEATIHGSEQHRRRGKKLLAVLLRERGRRPADRHNEIQLGTPERGAQASDDRIIGRADAFAGRLKCDLDVVNRLG